MRESGVGQAAEIDDVGALRDEALGAPEDRLGRQHRRIDDLGEDRDVVAGQVDRSGAASEISGQVDDLVGAALDRHAEMRRKAGKIGAAASRHDDAGRALRARRCDGG